MQFYRRDLPKICVSFSSTEGKHLFRESLSEGHMECYFRLAAQFRTQDDPAFCGLSTLVMILNALEIDPKRVWKGPWRWYHEEMLDCCIPLEDIRKKGITFTQFACIAECNGLEIVRECQVDDTASKEAFKMNVLETTLSDHQVLVVSYSRKALKQTGDGHFAPIGGYNSDKDSILLFDTARFKYPPHWVKLNDLWEAMKMIDKETNRPRGYLILKRDDKRSNLSFRIEDRLYGALMSPSNVVEKRSKNLVSAWNSWLHWLEEPCEGNSEIELLTAAVRTIVKGMALNNYELFFLKMPMMCHDVDDHRSELYKAMKECEFGIKLIKIVSEVSDRTESPKPDDCCKTSYFERIEVCIMIFILSFPYSYNEGSWGHSLSNLCSSSKKKLEQNIMNEIENLHNIFASLLRFELRSSVIN